MQHKEQHSSLWDLSTVHQYSDCLSSLKSMVAELLSFYLVGISHYSVVGVNHRRSEHLPSYAFATDLSNLKPMSLMTQEGGKRDKICNHHPNHESYKDGHTRPTVFLLVSVHTTDDPRQ